MDPIKEAFSRIKDEISLLKDEIASLKSKIDQIQTTQAYNSVQTHQQTDNPTHIQENNHTIQGLYSSNMNSSIGNEGVPTDRQTNKPTNQQARNYPQITSNSDFKQANEILESLDSIKKGIRLKFKRLTPQEMLVFSVLYGLEDQNYNEITYRTLANQIKLSESSIRDYVNKLIAKGVPIEKIRQNNKTIILKISQDLKKIATLAAIQNLREL